MRHPVPGFSFPSRSLRDCPADVVASCQAAKRSGSSSPTSSICGGSTALNTLKKYLGMHRKCTNARDRSALLRCVHYDPRCGLAGGGLLLHATFSWEVE